MDAIEFIERLLASPAGQVIFVLTVFAIGTLIFMAYQSNRAANRNAEKQNDMSEKLLGIVADNQARQATIADRQADADRRQAEATAQLAQATTRNNELIGEISRRQSEADRRQADASTQLAAALTSNTEMVEQLMRLVGGIPKALADALDGVEARIDGTHNETMDVLNPTAAATRQANAAIGRLHAELERIVSGQGAIQETVLALAASNEATRSTMEAIAREMAALSDIGAAALEAMNNQIVESDT